VAVLLLLVLPMQARFATGAGAKPSLLTELSRSSIFQLAPPPSTNAAAAALLINNRVVVYQYWRASEFLV